MTGLAARLLRVAAPIGLLLWAAHALRAFLLEPGLPVFFDAHGYVARVQMAAEAFRTGSLPWWSFDWYGGSRLFEFNGQLYFGLAGLLAAAIGDAVVATKQVLFGGQLAACLAFYAAGRRLGLAPACALLFGLLFVEAPQRAWVLGVVGNHASVLLYLGVAGYLWVAGAARDASASTWRLASWRALVLAALPLAHLQAVFLMPGLLVFDAVLLSGSVGFARAFRVLALTGCGAAALCAWVWLPLLLDAPLVSLSLDTASVLRAFDLAPLRIALGLDPFTFDYVFVRGQGLQWSVIALASSALAAATGHRVGIALAAGMFASMATTALVGERGVLAVGVFVWPLCALLPSLVAIRLPSRQRVVEMGLVAGGFALLVFPIAAPRPMPPRYVGADVFDSYASLPATPTRSRTFDMTERSLCLDGFYGWSSAAPLASGRPVVFGGTLQAMPLAGNLTMALLAPLGREPTHSEGTLNALFLAHVGFLVAPESGEVERLEDASPAIWAPVAQTLPSEFAGAASEPGGLRLLERLRERWREDPLQKPAAVPSLDPLSRTQQKRDWEVLAPAVERMEIDRGRAVAARFFVDGETSPSEAAGGGGALTVASHRESGHAVDLELNVPAEGWLRLSYPYDPAFEVRVDDSVVKAGRDAFGATLIRVSGGHHRVSIRVGFPAWRGVLLLACALSACALVWFGWPAGARAASSGPKP